MDKFVVRTTKSSNSGNPAKQNSKNTEKPTTSIETGLNDVDPIEQNAKDPEDKLPSGSTYTGDNAVSTSSKRRFVPKWRETYQWLSYNDVTKKAYCSVCIEAYNVLKILLPNTGSNDDRAYQAFVKEGFDTWRNGLIRFKAHEKTEVHRKAASSIMTSQATSVVSLISAKSLQSRKEARSCLICIFETIRFLAVQNLPIRGNEEKTSNFVRLLILRAKDNPLLKSWMERSTYKWISHDVIDEILSIMSLAVQRELLLEIRNAPFYAVMADETTDASNSEQMSISFRIVDDDMKIKELFLGFYDTPTTDAETLFSILKDALLRFQLKINKCRGQCYDGANNVSGEITGLQTRFREEEPRAIYTHCAGHNFSLACQDCMKAIPEIADFLSNMKNLVTFCRASAKRHNIFKSIEFDEEEDYDEYAQITGKDKIGSLKPFCPTRWTVRVQSLKSIKQNYKRILKLCEVVGLETTDSGIKARGFSSYLQKFESLILLEICISALEQIEEVNTTIQATTISFKSIIKRVGILKTSLSALRTNDKFHKIWTATLECAKNLALHDPVLPRQRVPPKRIDENTKTAYFPSTPEERYRTMYFGVIDQALTSLDTRFDSENYRILCSLEDFALDKCKIDEIKDFLYHDGDCDFDLDRLVLHKQMFLDHIKSKNIVADDLTKISIFLQKNKVVKDFCSEYSKFIKLLLTAPQTVCIAERSFSSLKLLKTYIRSNLTQKKTNDLALLYIHRDIADALDIESLVDEFISRATVRRNTFALRSEI